MKTHPRDIILGFFRKYNLYWDIGEQRLAKAIGFEPYLSSYFHYAQNNGKIPLYILADGIPCGFVLISPLREDRGIKTVSVIGMNPAHVNQFLESGTIETIFQLIPSKWTITLSKSKDERSHNFWRRVLQSCSKSNGKVSDMEEEKWYFTSPEQYVSWDKIWFGIEFEFMGAHKKDVIVPTGWDLSAEEWLFANGPLRPSVDGDPSLPDVEITDGAELRTPPMQYDEIDNFVPVLGNLKAAGSYTNYSCALHVHISLQHWGDRIIPQIIESALHSEKALREILQSSPYRFVFCEPYTNHTLRQYNTATNNRERYLSLISRWEPSLRFGINLSSFWDRQGSVEIRYANGSLDFVEVRNVVELYLKYIAAIQGSIMHATNGLSLLDQLGISTDRRYPPPDPIPEDWADGFSYWFYFKTDSIYNIFDDKVEYGEPYLQCFKKWLEYELPDLNGKEILLTHRYRLVNDVFIVDIMDAKGNKIKQLEEKLYAKGIKEMSEHISKKGNEEIVKIKKISNDYIKLENGVGGFSNTFD
jgi:hypothetical protein